MKEPDNTLSKIIKKAAALKYNKEIDTAPRIVGTGRGELAEKIVEIARDKGIAVFSDPELVDELIKLDISQEIPSHLYNAVAQILVFVYNLDKQQS